MVNMFVPARLAAVAAGRGEYPIDCCANAICKQAEWKRPFVVNNCRALQWRRNFKYDVRNATPGRQVRLALRFLSFLCLTSFFKC